MNKYQEALQNLYDKRGELIDVYNKNEQWANNIKIYDFIGHQLRTLQELVDKLQDLKNIEEELGIPLITLFKALKGIWIKDNDRTYYVGSPYLCYAENNKRELEFQFKVGEIWHYVKDYGKTWAFTRKEL